MNDLPIIVAHRGLSALYPENTAIAIEQAISAGARAVEFDVQLTTDIVPVVFHDLQLERLTGSSGQITRQTLQQLRQLRVPFRERFDDEFSNEPILTLEQAMQLFATHPRVTPCLEIKEESIDTHGLTQCIEAILHVTGAMTENMLLLSFSYPVIERLHQKGLTNTVWVLRDYDDEHLNKARELGPAVLAVNFNKLYQAGGVFWQGDWQWMVYQTEDPAEVRKLTQLGADYIETDNIRLIADALPEYF